MTIEASLKAAKRSCRGTPPLSCALLKFDMSDYHLAALRTDHKRGIKHGGVMSAMLVIMQLSLMNLRQGRQVQRARKGYLVLALLIYPKCD